MEKTIFLATVLLLAPSLAARADDGKTVPGRCLAVVDGKTQMKSTCFVALEAGGGFTMKQLVGDEYHVVPDKAAGTAKATWRAPFEGTDGHGRLRKFGPLRRDGACWVGDRVRFCAWSGEAQMLANRAAPYTDFHPLVGKDVKAYCHMNECQWFRYDSAKLVDHSAHEALFEIHEHRWDTEHPDGNYDKVGKAEGDVSEDTFYARCSRTRPSILDAKGKGGYDFAPATDDGTTGVAAYAYVEYAAACHGLRDAITGAQGYQLGYPLDGGAGENDTKLADPKDALK